MKTLSSAASVDFGREHVDLRDYALHLVARRYEDRGDELEEGEERFDRRVRADYREGGLHHARDGLREDAPRVVHPAEEGHYLVLGYRADELAPGVDRYLRDVALPHQVDALGDRHGRLD